MSHRSTIYNAINNTRRVLNDGLCQSPFELVCPIRHVLMVHDPVLAPDGYTYEREAIVEWLERGGAGGGDHTAALSPMTHEPLGNATLVSNVAIRTMARDWFTKMAKSDGGHS